MDMEDRKKLGKVRYKLIKWWTSHDFGKGLFPWRSPGISPYRALITEILLQRTRSETVKSIYKEFFTKFPNAHKLSASSESEILAVIECLGFSFRAKNLVELGKAIKNGIPEEIDKLLKLPNVGIYVAGAYLSLHRRVRAIIPDANMARVLGRLFGFKLHPETRREKPFLELCDRITPLRKFKEFNYAILDYGRMVCMPRSPKCLECIFKNDCEYWVKFCATFRSNPHSLEEFSKQRTRR